MHPITRYIASAHRVSPRSKAPSRVKKVSQPAANLCLRPGIELGTAHISRGSLTMTQTRRRLRAAIKIPYLTSLIP